MPLGNSAWYRHDVPSADKSKFFSSKVPLLMAFPTSNVFSLGTIPVTMVTFGLPSSLQQTVNLTIYQAE